MSTLLARHSATNPRGGRVAQSSSLCSLPLLLLLWGGEGGGSMEEGGVHVQGMRAHRCILSGLHWLDWVSISWYWLHFMVCWLHFLVSWYAFLVLLVSWFNVFFMLSKALDTSGTINIHLVCRNGTRPNNTAMVNFLIATNHLSLIWPRAKTRIKDFTYRGPVTRHSVPYPVPYPVRHPLPYPREGCRMATACSPPKVARGHMSNIIHSLFNICPRQTSWRNNTYEV